MAKDKTVVRVLSDLEVDGKKYKANHLVAFAPELAKSLVKDKAADDTKEAVAYVKSQGGEVIEHVVEADAAKEVGAQ